MRSVTKPLFELVTLVAIVGLLTACGNGPNSENSVVGTPASDAASVVHDPAESTPFQPTPVTQEGPPSTVDGPDLAAIPTMQPPRQAGVDDNGDGRYTHEEFMQALTDAYPQYVYAPGYDVPLDSILADWAAPMGYEASYEVPGELMVIGMSSQCSWLYAWQDATRTGDSASANAALEHVENINLETQLMSGSLADMLEMIERARLGDPARLNEYVLYSCSPAPFETGPDATALPDQ